MSKYVVPTTIGGIKRLARQIQRSAAAPLSYSAALDQAAAQSGFANFIHARRQLGSFPPVSTATPAVAQPPHFALVSAIWRSRDKREMGREELKIPIATPLGQLLKPHHLNRGRNLTGYRFAGGGELHHDGFFRTQEEAQKSLCGVARTFTFMETTGLTPSEARNRGYPKGNFQNRPPRCDHQSIWFDSTSKAYVLVDEPYSWSDDAGVPRERLDWAAEFGWTVLKSKWGGMYFPDGGCELYLAADQAKGYDLASIVARLDALPEAKTVDAWDGISIPIPNAFGRGVA